MARKKKAEIAMEIAVVAETPEEELEETPGGKGKLEGKRLEDIGPFQLRFHDGREDIVVSRSELGCYELRRQVSDGSWDMIGRYYTSIGSLVSAIFERKVGNAAIRTLEDLQIQIARIRKEIFALSLFDDDLK